MKKISLFILNIFLFLVLAACGNSCDHQWTEWRTTKNPTCDTNGEKVRHCTECLEEKKEIIEKLGHSFGEAYAKNENGHYHFCDVCEYEEKIEAHTPAEANELGNIYCSTCQYLLFENKNSFYDTLLKAEKSYILELKDFIITKEFYEIIDQEMVFDEYIGNLDGYAIFMLKENGYNILVQGDLTIDQENAVAKLDALFDGENLYFKCSLDSDEMDEEIYSAKIKYEQIVKLLTDNYGEAPEMLLANYATSLNLITSLLNIADNELIQIIVDFLFTKEEITDGYTLEFNLDKLVDLINFGTSKPISSIFDKIFGNGKYEINKKNLLRLFDTKLSTIIKMMKAKYDIDLKQVLLDACNAMGEDPSEIEIFFNDTENMKKTLIEIISEEDNITREEVLEDLDEMFRELESFILYTKSDISVVLDAINLISDSVILIVTTDKAGYITQVDVDLDVDFIENTTINGKLSITEYTNSAEFNKIADQIIKLYEETVPTIPVEKFEELEEDKIIISDSSITIQIKKMHWTYDYTFNNYQSLYYYEYGYYTFNLDEIGGITISNYHGTNMDNSTYECIEISVIGNCSGKIIVDDQLYNEDGTEAFSDYSLYEEVTINDEQAYFNIYYNITDDRIHLSCYLYE